MATFPRKESSPFFYIEIWLIYNVMLDSGVRTVTQSTFHIYIYVNYIYILFQILPLIGYYKILSAIQ